MTDVGTGTGLRDDVAAMRGRIIEVSYALGQTEAGVRDVTIRGIGAAPSVGDALDWTDRDESWKGTVERVEENPAIYRWTAWVTAYLMERPDA